MISCHTKTRLPVAVDLEAHMKVFRRKQEWGRATAFQAAMFSSYGSPPPSKHDQNVNDYLADKITIQEYERREGERLAS